MSLAVTRQELRERALRRADMVNSTFRTSAEVSSIVNTEYRKAYALLCDADDDWNIDSEDFTTSAGQSVYALPADFYRLKGLDAYPSGTTGDAVKVPRFRWDERNKYSTTGGWTTFGPTAYRLRGSNVALYPTPPAGIVLRYWYTPAAPLLADDADTIDASSGIDELVVVGVARVLLTEEGDLEAAAALAAEYAQVFQQVLANVQGRAEPEQAGDVIREVLT